MRPLRTALGVIPVKAGSMRQGHAKVGVPVGINGQLGDVEGLSGGMQLAYHSDINT